VPHYANCGWMGFAGLASTDLSRPKCPSRPAANGDPDAHRCRARVPCPRVILSERAPSRQHAMKPARAKDLAAARTALRPRPPAPAPDAPDAHRCRTRVPAPACHPERACPVPQACHAASASEGSGGPARGTPPSDRLPPRRTRRMRTDAEPGSLPPRVILSERAPSRQHAMKPARAKDLAAARTTLRPRPPAPARDVNAECGGGSAWTGQEILQSAPGCGAMRSTVQRLLQNDMALRGIRWKPGPLPHVSS
jgi:hypothetical protein